MIKQIITITIDEMNGIVQVAVILIKLRIIKIF